jgi:hypothetical protein
MPDNKFVLVPELTDDEIAKVLHSVGIDTYPSKYGFDALQVSATSVPMIREIVAAYLAAAPQAAPMPDEREALHSWVAERYGTSFDSFTYDVMEEAFAAGIRQARAALSAAPVSEQPQEASTAQPDSEREAIASALAFVADSIERFDDKTMEGNYMLDASECAGIVRAMQTFPFRATITAPQDAQERDATKLRRPLCGGAGNVGEEPEL